MSTFEYDFERFPRRLLQFKFNRRQLFVNVKIELEVAEGEQQGGKGLKLSMLGILPDSQLEMIVPVILPDSQISLKEGAIWGKCPGHSTWQKLFPKDDTTLFVFNLINGRTPIYQIAHRLQQYKSWEAAQSFAFVRGLFLHLVQLQICVPS